MTFLAGRQGGLFDVADARRAKEQREKGKKGMVKP